MASIDSLLVKEKLLRQRIDKVIENGKKTAIAKRNQGFYEARIADLRKLWEQFSNNDLEIHEILVKEKIETIHPYVANDTYGITESKYSDYLAELLDGLRKLSSSNDVKCVPSNSNIQPTVINSQESLLPKVELPKFNGDYDKWQSFHDLFSSIVHNNERLTSVKKLYYLKSCLVGDAERVLRHTPITDQDYDQAWSKLKGRYENKRILVNHQLKTLLNQPKLSNENAKGIKTLIDTTDECLQQLKGLEVNISSWDVLLIHILVQKLPFQTLRLWEEKLGGSNNLPTFSEFNTFLKDRLKVLESIADTVVPKQTQSKHSHNDRVQALHVVKTDKCPACSANHFIKNCPKYTNLDVPARRELIKGAGRCFNCFSSRHSVKKCLSKYRCMKCKRKHHTTLHIEYYGKDDATKSNENMQLGTTNQVNKSSTSNNKVNTTNGTQSFFAVENHQALLATALVRVENERGEFQILRCLVDTGSQSSFITEAACKKLRPKMKSTNVEIKGLNSSQAAMANRKTKLKLKHSNGKTSAIEDEFLIVKQITEPLPTSLIVAKDWRHLQRLELADPTFWKPGKIDALLGAKVYTKIIRDGIRRGGDLAPVAINTMFGWILLGSIRNSKEQSASTSTTLMTTAIDVELNNQLKKFWEMEEVHHKQMLTEEEQQCQVMFKRSFKRLQNGKYQVKIPFINDQSPILGESRPQALKRFSHLQQQFARKPNLEKDYKKCLNEYIDLDHMEEINPPSSNKKNYYIPHHAVFKESTTTKLKIRQLKPF